MFEEKNIKAPQKRKKKDTTLKHQKILDGAIEVFTKYGFESSSMDKIAEVAGVSKSTVYSHFKSKEALFQTIVFGFMQRGTDMQPIEYIKTIPLKEQLIGFAKGELYAVDTPEHIKLSRLVHSIFSMNVELGVTALKEYRKNNERFIEWLKAAKADNKLKFDDPELVCEIFFGMIDGSLILRALYSNGENLSKLDKTLDELIEVFLARYKC